MGEREGDWDGREKNRKRPGSREIEKKIGAGEREKQEWERKGERKDRKKNRVGEKQIGREP